MPIFVDRSSRVICQGAMTERELFHIQQCTAYGTKVVAWVYADTDEKEKLGLPVFSSVREARRQASATVSLIFVEPQSVFDAVLEAIDGGIETIVCITSGVPVHDMAAIKYILSKNTKSRFIGPGSCGVLTPSQCKAGVMPGYVFSLGSVGMISAVDSLGYTAARQITQAGLGISTFCGIGSELMRGEPIADLLAAFEEDAETEAVVLLLLNGESEVDAIVEWTENGGRKPILACVAGYSTVPLKSLFLPVGELSLQRNTVEVLQEAKVKIIEDIHTIGSAVQQVVVQHRLKEIS